jgi:hypothetical protein
MKRVLILAHADDSGAMQVAKVIGSQLGSQAIEVIPPEILATFQWSHHIDSEGKATTLCKLPNQREFFPDSIGCLFNRLRYVSHIPFAHSLPKNRDYAVAELHALIISWIYELGMRVVNPLSLTSGIVSPISPSKWLSLAQQCGLPIGRYRKATAGSLIGKLLPGELLHPYLDLPGGSGAIPVEVLVDKSTFVSEESVLVCGDRAFGRLTEEFGVPCLMLANKIKCNLLEIRFGLIGGQYRVVEISPYPLLENPWAVNVAAQMIIDLALGTGGLK